MPSIANIRNEREFYKDFFSLVTVLKTVAISQFQSLERKMLIFREFIPTVESFLDLMEVPSIVHPFVDPKEAPLGIVAITSDTGLLGGLNRRVMMAAFSYRQSRENQFIIVGAQGKKFVHGLDVLCKTFTAGDEECMYHRSLEVRDYLIEEVLSGRIGPVKVIYPFASSMQIQKVMELDFLPCGKWMPENKEGDGGGRGALEEDVLFESYPQHLIEYVVYLWLGQKIFEILQFSRLAEYAARASHLEDSSAKIKNIEKKLQHEYFRARHEIIDQQMRELFAARAIYAG